MFQESVHLCGVLLCVLALLDVAVLAVEQCFSILVQLQLRNHHLGRVDWNGHALPIGLVPGDTLHMNAELLSVHLRDLSLAVMVVTSHDHHLIVSANGHRSHSILGSQVLAQRSRHQLAPDVRGRCEVRLAILPPGACNCGLLLHGEALYVTQPDYNFPEGPHSRHAHTAAKKM